MTSRKVTLTILLFLIVGLTTTLFYVAINHQPETKTNTNLFAIMLEDDDGTYFESDLSMFPEDYIYNEEKTYCVNGASITWNNTTRTASVTADGSEKCYIYFDKLTTTFTYTGTEQKYIVSETGTYKIELWGASGSGRSNYHSKAAYTSGLITLNEGTILYIHVGENGQNIISSYNSGGTAYSTAAGSGGGATDIRLVSGDWNSQLGLRSRIMVAAGGGGGIILERYTPGHGGGLTGYVAYDSLNPAYTSGGGTQTSGGVVNNYNSSYIAGTNGSFGISGSGGGAQTGGSASGGGGYYGGAGGSRLSNSSWPSGGGSSYISGHTGAVAITSASNETPKSGCTTGTTNNACSTHYSGYKFTSTVMIDGAGYNWTNVKGSQVAMPNPLGGNYELGQGHLGNGYAKITLIK